jgi:putative peptidoglycan lipid II flippase
VSESKKSSRSLVGIAGIVAVATLISKVFGLVRQVAIAAAFGVGPAVDAYNYAYVIPGFLLILLGGINGPFHSAIVSVLAKREKEEAAPLVETITTLVGGVLLIVTVFLIFFADPMIDLVAPGLMRTSEGLYIKSIAVQQFKIMAPMALLAGLIGIGFGTLNAADMYWLPSISPLFSSVALIGGLGIFALQVGDKITEPKYAFLGGLVLAWGTLIGAILQWLVQVWTQWQAGLGKLRLRFNFKDPSVKEVTKIMLPATLSSGMLQINVYTDLFFASYIPQAAAAMGYAGLLVQTPLGIISNVILVPFLPIFSRLTDPENWGELKDKIRQALIFTGLTMLPFSALMVTLALPIVRVVYERVAFNKEASQFVTPVLMAYAIGMFVYLGRDVLVRVFYALGDGETPFRISIINIFLNAVFDYLLVNVLGAPGLVLATVAVNLISMVWLIVLLDKRLNGLPWAELGLPFIGLTMASIFTGFVSWGTLKLTQYFFGSNGLILLLIELGIASFAGLGIFALLVIPLKLPEVDMFVARISQRFRKKG